MRRIWMYCVLALSVTACGDIESRLGDLKELSSVLPEEIIYKPIGECEDGSFAFVSLGTAGVRLWNDPAEVLTAQVELYIHPDKTYHARYREYGFTDLKAERWIQSQYSIDWQRDLLFFDGLGVGAVEKVGRRIYLNFEFTNSIYSELLKGQSARFRIFKSNQGVDTDRGDYCGF